jgi:hypothetical protein
MLDRIPCTAKQLAAVLGIGERRVSELTRVRTFVKPYELLTCVRSYVDFIRQDQGSLRTERTRVAKLKADLLELTYKQRSGELVLRSAVGKAWFHATRTCRDNVLNLPARTDALVAAESDRQKCYFILEREVRLCLQSLTDSEPVCRRGVGVE